MGGKSGLLFKLWIFSVLLIFISSALVISGPVFAQDDQEEFTLEEIVVTGSRIARNNNESTSPIVTVDADLFDQSATGAIETQLNKLPQFTPTGDVPQVDGQDIQPTALNTPGSSTIALRGIGANRTLTLINGRRGTPSNAMGSVDINTIPTAAIQYVEMISGGASSTYGADAMAGVVNFIMKDRFEGFEFDILGSMSEYWDNEEFTTSAVMGTNFDDDRGNIMMAFAYNNRKGALQGERPWFRENWRDPSINGTQFFGTATGLDLGTTNLPTADALNAAMELPGAFTTVPGGLVLYTLQGGNEVFSGYQNFLGQANGPQGVPAAVALGIVDGYNTKITTSGNLSSNNTRAYLIYPLERYNFYTQGNYEINDHIGVFGQAYFSRSNAKTIQEPGVLSGGWSASVDPSINRNSIPSEVLDVLDSREYPDAPVSLLALLPEGRVGNTDSLTFNMTGGIEGDIPGIDWTWEVFMSHGESETTSNMTGFYSLMRFREIIEAPDFGKGMVFKGNPEYGGFGSADATCTSGLNPFDWASVTQDCWDAVAAPVKSKQLMEQQIWEANAQGPIADLPMGEMRGAVGISYRQNDYYFLSDNVNTQGRSFNDQILGLYPAGESEGTIRAKEAYAELLVPVLKDLPLVKQLELSLGGRRSDYNTTGVSYTYKAELNWKALDFLRFRGGYNRAERAPNIGELYLARTSLFAAMYNGDTCSMDNRTTAWTASPESNPDGWQDVVSLCGQLMESGGDTNADNEYYGEDWAAIYNYAEANGGAVLPSMLVEGEDGNTLIENQPDGGMTYIWPVDVGNAALSPEIADTYTFGFVLDSWIDSIPALMDWRASLDFYSIKIKDAIGLQTGDVVMPAVYIICI